MEYIRLSRGEWKYDPSRPLGEAGGFGAVFEGHSADHGRIAIKKLHLDATALAHREMRMAASLLERSLKHVIPILDAGADELSGFYFVVMPMAEKSLQDLIDSSAPISETETAKILLQVVEGLLEVKDIVHRDIKPQNILFHDGCWKVADFGIARFVEQSTSQRTLKDWLSEDYAAPEQWNRDRASSATDLYALGCLGYALLTGMPPFAGQSSGELREKHLKNDPPSLPGIWAELSDLLQQLLRKTPESRPSPERVKKRLLELIGNRDVSNRMNLSTLKGAGDQVERLEAEAETKSYRERLELKDREEIGKSGLSILHQVLEHMFQIIETEVAVVKWKRPDWTLELGAATLKAYSQHYSIGTIIPRDSFPESKWDAVLLSVIRVEQRQPAYSWSASLWYCKLPGTTEYRWYEVCYFSPFSPVLNGTPYALTTIVDADSTAGPALGNHQIAFGPNPIDDECQEEFIERWSVIFGVAATGKLRYPRHLRLPPKFWESPFVS